MEPIPKWRIEQTVLEIIKENKRITLEEIYQKCPFKETDTKLAVDELLDNGKIMAVKDIIYMEVKER